MHRDTIEEEDEDRIVEASRHRWLDWLLDADNGLARHSVLEELWTTRVATPLRPERVWRDGASARGVASASARRRLDGDGRIYGADAAGGARVRVVGPQPSRREQLSPSAASAMAYYQHEQRYREQLDEQISRHQDLERGLERIDDRHTGQQAPTLARVVEEECREARIRKQVRRPRDNQSSVATNCDRPLALPMCVWLLSSLFFFGERFGRGESRRQLCSARISNLIGRRTSGLALSWKGRRCPCRTRGVALTTRSERCTGKRSSALHKGCQIGRDELRFDRVGAEASFFFRRALRMYSGRNAVKKNKIKERDYFNAPNCKLHGAARDAHSFSCRAKLALKKYTVQYERNKS